MKQCTFYIVRHGNTEWNNKKLIQGFSDSPLTAEGIAQAKARAQTFMDIEFAAAFSSDLLRAKRTAEIILADRELVVTASKLLREQRFGKFEGKHINYFRQELREQLNKRAKLSDEQYATFRLHDEIETDQEITTRFITFLRETAFAYAGKNILVVSHGAMLRTLLVKLGYATYSQMQPHYIENLGYFILESIIKSDGIDFEVKSTHGVHIDLDK